MKTALLAVALLGLHVPASVSETFEATTADCDAQRGQVVFTKCAVCHTAEAGAGHSLGPNLHGIVGRPVGAAEGFLYTPGLKEYGENWTLELLDRYLASPMTEVPGTSMAFAGLKKSEDREAVLCFLKQAR